VPALPATNGKAGIAVEPINPFVIGPHALSADQSVQAAITEPATLPGQFDQSRFQLLVLWLNLRLVVQNCA
jgi:hypothetical protein